MGWGAVKGQLNCSGLWSQSKFLLHINLLKAMTVFQALQSCEQSLRNGVLLVQNHSTVLSELQRGGGKSYLLDQLTWDIALWCLERASLCTQSIFQVPTMLMRIFCLQLTNRQLQLEKSVKWSLKQGMVKLLFRVCGSPWVDLFTTSANSKPPVFYSRVPEPSFTCNHRFCCYT